MKTEIHNTSGGETHDFNRLITKFIPITKYLETSHGSIDTFQFLKQKQNLSVGFYLND